jgi:hypothetical protein
MNDLLHYAMREAVRLYGDRGDNLFTGAALSTVLSRITGSKACVDGRLIAALLVGRCDVQPLTGGSHYRCIEASGWRGTCGRPNGIAIERSRDMNQPLVPLEGPDMISQGKVYMDLETALGEVQDRFTRYVIRHGILAAKAKATVNLNVEFTVDEAKAAMIGEGKQGPMDIRAQVKIKLPDAPPYVSTGIVCQTEHGHRVFVQRGGSKKDDPRQQVLCTDDGRTVDPVTGEIQFDFRTSPDEAKIRGDLEPWRLSQARP